MKVALNDVISSVPPSAFRFKLLHMLIEWHRSSLFAANLCDHKIIYLTFCTIWASQKQTKDGISVEGGETCVRLIH
jgi:hypothetical protein